MPYPAELNDSASIIHRRDNARDFATMIVDQFDEMLRLSEHHPLVMTISLHAFVVGQAFRLKPLREAMRHCVEHAGADKVWWTTPGAIADHCYQLPSGIIPRRRPAGAALISGHGPTSRRARKPAATPGDVKDMTRHTRTAALAALMLTTAMGAASAEGVEHPQVKLSLDWAFQGPQSVFLLGEEKGFYKDHGLDVTVDRGSGSGDTVLRVASGAYDFGWADIASMAKFNLQNPDKKLIAVYVTGANSPLAVVSVKGRGIEKPTDLAGKKLTATASSSALALFDVFAKKNDLDPKSVTWLQVSGQLREPMMVRGESDALAGFTTSSIMTVADLGVPVDDIVVMRYNDYGVQQYGTAIIVRPDFVKENPETVKAMVAAINDSFKAAIKDPNALRRDHQVARSPGRRFRRMPAPDRGPQEPHPVRRVQDQGSLQRRRQASRRLDRRAEGGLRHRRQPPDVRGLHGRLSALEGRPDAAGARLLQLSHPGFPA